VVTAAASSSWTTMRPAALLLGRRTYEGFAAAWPERDGEFADKKRRQLSSSAVVGDGIAIQVYTRT
jgi:dihydrofolate reductase